MLYLVWIASPALHQIHLRLAHGAAGCRSCPAQEPGWRIFSHPPDEPCSDPDHHHHPGPVHDEEHCLSCRLGTAATVALPCVGTPLEVAQVAASWPARSVGTPLSPAMPTHAPRAPPPPPSL